MNEIKADRRRCRRYEPIQTIGRGAYGVVMKCRDALTGGEVAVKKIVESYTSTPEVLRELTALRRLDGHPNVINVLNAFRVRDSLYIVFPLVDYTMGRFIADRHPDGLGYGPTKEFMVQIIRGIDHIHSNHIVHRDVKTENILLTANGTAKICDLGISRMIGSPSVSRGSEDLLMTSDMGTLWYQAPEILLGTQNYGVVFAECMTGYPMVARNSTVRQYRSIVEHLGVPLAEQESLNRTLNSSHNNGAFPMDYVGGGGGGDGFASAAAALKHRYPAWPADLVEIASKCLRFRPSERATAAQLLNESSYFAEGKAKRPETPRRKRKIVVISSSNASDL